MRKIEKDWSSVNTMQSRVEVGIKVTLPPRSATLISGRKWWPPKAVENFRGAEVVTMVVQCRCTRSCLFPPLWVEPMFQSGPPPTNPLFQTLVKTTFSQRNFSRASTFASSSSFEEHRWKNWTIFWNFLKYTSGSPLTSTPREKSFLLCNFEFSRIFYSLVRGILFERW